MNKLKFACLALVLTAGMAAQAGGILTNTNQSVAFLRNPARDGAIGLDGVYSNPAGVIFLGEGLHLGFNWQYAHQTRTITSQNQLFKLGAKNNGLDTQEFEGVANAPFIPSLQAAYNKGDWSFQFNFSVPGGGGSRRRRAAGGPQHRLAGRRPGRGGGLAALFRRLGHGQGDDMAALSGVLQAVYPMGQTVRRRLRDPGCFGRCRPAVPGRGAGRGPLRVPADPAELGSAGTALLSGLAGDIRRGGLCAEQKSSLHGHDRGARRLRRPGCRQYRPGAGDHALFPDACPAALQSRERDGNRIKSPPVPMFFRLTLR